VCNFENTTTNFVHNPLAYIPFSYGLRNCIRRALARQEMLVVAALFDKGNWVGLEELAWKVNIIPPVVIVF
jgi:cytochrome P450